MARKDPCVPIRSLSALALSLFASACISVLAANKAFAHSSSPASDIEIYRSLSFDEVGARVLEFLRARPFPQKENESLLDNARSIEFASAGETPSKSHSAEEEALKWAQQLQQIVLPNGSNALTAFAKRYLSDTKSSIECNGTQAAGIAQLAGELYRFESRANGDVLILPPFEKGSAILVKPSRIDLGQASQTISSLVDQHKRDPTVAPALEIDDGPARLICERLQLMTSNPRAASMCDKLYQKQISVEGRCNRLDGDYKSECLRKASDILRGKHLIAFEQDLLGFRHPTTGQAPLVKYGCEVQNETCGILTNTDAAYKLSKKDFDGLRLKISQANRGRVFKKADFLQQASALRPLGQCCASSGCRSKLESATSRALKFSNRILGTTIPKGPRSELV